MIPVSRCCIFAPCVLTAVICTLLASKLYGLTYSTPEQIAARAIASWTEDYSKRHEGAVPRSWEDLQPLLDVPVNEVMGYAAPSKRYAFVTPPLELAAPLRGELVAMNRSDIFDSTLSTSVLGYSSGLNGPGRYVIYRATEGKFSFAWVTSEYVHALFSRANVMLPTPDNEPERIWVKKVRQAHQIWTVVFGALAAGLACWLWRYFRRETSWGMVVGFWYDDLRKRKHG